MATRFRLENNEGGTIIPAVGGTYTHERSAAPASLTVSALSTFVESKAYSPDGSDHLVSGDSRISRFIGEPMDAGIGFVTSDTVKYAVQCFESNANNNLFLQLAVHVISQDGNTLRSTIRGKVSDGTEMATTHTSRTSSHNLDANYTTVSGDRLLVEISGAGLPSASGGVQGHNWGLRIGSGGASGDLLENDAQTDIELNPWIEFSRTITFLVIADDFMGQSCISL
jgi:hypothetical protein